MCAGKKKTDQQRLRQRDSEVTYLSPFEALSLSLRNARLFLSGSILRCN